MAIATDPEVETTLADLLESLGGISPGRVRLNPPPGLATELDLIAINGRKRGIVELIDGVLVEKAMGMLESLLAGVMIALLRDFVVPRNLGIITSPDGMIRLTPTLFRAPDIAFLPWTRIPDGPLSESSLAGVIPDLAVEILSPSNTAAEMARKRREYFEAGVCLVWEVNPRSRTITVFLDPDRGTILEASEILGGGEVLPGFVLPLAALFGELDRRGT